MDISQFKDRLFANGYELGFEDMEIGYQVDCETTVRVFKKQIDAFYVSEKAGLSFRGKYQDRVGMAYVESLSEEAIEFLLREALEIAQTAGQEQDEFYEGSSEYPEVQSFSPSIAELSPQQLIEIAQDMEDVVMQYDPRIEMVNLCLSFLHVGQQFMWNSRGLACQTRSAKLVNSLSVVAREGTEVATGTVTHQHTKNVSPLDWKKTARDAAQEAVSRLHARSIKSGSYKVILRNDAASKLLKAFAQAFSGEAVMKGVSKLQGKIGEQVAVPSLTLLDDPHMPYGPNSTSFDAEGVATRPHYVIENGVLRTFLHNRNSARIFGVESTGNAVKQSYRSIAHVQPHCMYVVPGERSLADMEAELEKGLLIVDFQGVHSGTNYVTGDFSLSCNGHLVEEGKRIRPLNQITVSGNFFELLQRIEEVGSDLTFQGTGKASCGCPSIKIKSLSISGE